MLPICLHPTKKGGIADWKTLPDERKREFLEAADRILAIIELCDLKY
jgi:hypothetical protein